MLFLLQSQARLCWTGTNGCQQEAVPDTRLPYNCAARARASLWAVTGGGYGCFLLRFYVCHSTAPARTELSLPPTCPSLLGSSVRESGARAVPNVQGIRARGDRLGSRGAPREFLSISAPGCGGHQEGCGGATWQHTRPRLATRVLGQRGGLLPGAYLSEGAGLLQARGIVLSRRQSSGGTGPPARSKGTGGFWSASIYGNARNLPARTCRLPLAVMRDPSWGKQRKRFGERGEGFGMSSLK